MKAVPIALAGALALSAAGAAVLAGGTAAADEHLVGSWSTSDSSSRGARAGESGHDLGSGDAFLSGSEEVWTFTIDEMQGRGFHAEWCSENACEDAVGVVRANGHILAADEDGTFHGTVLDSGELELCYLEPGTEFRVADCHTLAKDE
jgi:hypothetical protein